MKTSKKKVVGGQFGPRFCVYLDKRACTKAKDWVGWWGGWLFAKPGRGSPGGSLGGTCRRKRDRIVSHSRLQTPAAVQDDCDQKTVLYTSGVRITLRDDVFVCLRVVGFARAPATSHALRRSVPSVRSHRSEHIGKITSTKSLVESTPHPPPHPSINPAIFPNPPKRHPVGPPPQRNTDSRPPIPFCRRRAALHEKSPQ